MPHYKLKPVTVEARRFNGTEKNCEDMVAWLAEHGQTKPEVYQRYFMGKPDCMVLCWWDPRIPEDIGDGYREATPYDYVIRHGDGFQAMSEPEFLSKFERVPTTDDVELSEARAHGVHL